MLKMSEQQTENKKLRIGIDYRQSGREIRDLANKLTDFGFEVNYDSNWDYYALNLNSGEDSISGYKNVQVWLKNTLKRELEELETKFPNKYSRQYVEVFVEPSKSISCGLETDQVSLLKTATKFLSSLETTCIKFTRPDKEALLQDFLFPDGIIRAGISLNGFKASFSVDCIRKYDTGFNLREELEKSSNFGNDSSRECNWVYNQILYAEAPVDFDNIFPNIETVWRSVDKTLGVYD